MKEEIIKKLKSKYDALSLLEINDLLGLESPEELKELELTLEELVKEYVIYKTKKDKYILFNNYLINCQLNGIDFIAYANKLIDILDLNINTKIMYDNNDLSKTLLNIELIGYSNEGKQQTISYIIDADSKLIYDSITDEMQYKENLTKRTR